jgi:crossover junction endodeoxyribonuclease RuvC
MKAPKIILGIDPGLVNTGWGVVLKDVNNYRFLGCGTIVTDAKEDMPYRLREIYTGLKKVLETYSIDEAAIEETFVNKNNLTSLKLGHARGAIILTLSLADIAISEYSATNVKKSVVGVGRAEKDQVAMMVKVIMPKAVMKTEHEADALAVAICHGNTSKFI